MGKMVEMAKSTYTFGDVEQAPERERLRRIEHVFDPGSRRRLERAGIGCGDRCLEVGAARDRSLHGWRKPSAPRVKSSRWI